MKIYSAILASAILSSGSLHAQIYEVRIEASVSYIQGDIWDSSIKIGTPLTAVFQFNESIAPVVNAGQFAIYDFAAGPAGVKAGDYRINTAHDSLVIYNNPTEFGEGYQLDGFNSSGIAGLPNQFFGARLWSSNFNLISDVNQPVHSFPPSVFNLSNYFFFGGLKEPNNFHSLQESFATITSYTVVPMTPVPESSTFAGFACIICLSGIWFRVQRRRDPNN
jgi:hypothetical protein